MSFRMPKASKKYFEGMHKHRDTGASLDTMFDQYYLCFMAGIDRRKLGSDNDLESDEFIRNFPEDYRERVYLIIGLLIDAEMERRGITPDDRKSVEALMLKLLDHESITNLSTEGIHCLNLYSVGGFEIINEEIPKTVYLEEFLPAYVDMMNRN